jgi:hypothetical protein
MLGLFFFTIPNPNLDKRDLYCKRKGYPQLNSIVVNQDTGFPGDNYPAPMKPPEFLVERARVFAFGWSTKDKPHSDDFQAEQSAMA